MTPAEFLSAKAALGLSWRGFAAALKVAPTSARRYAALPSARSHRRIPPIVAELVRRLLAERDG